MRSTSVVAAIIVLGASIVWEVVAKQEQSPRLSQRTSNLHTARSRAKSSSGCGSGRHRGAASASSHRQQPPQQLSVRQQPSCPTCGTPRPVDWPVHPTWLAADATANAWADLWRTCLEQHERVAARYLPSDGDWTDADTQCSAVNLRMIRMITMPFQNCV